MMRRFLNLLGLAGAAGLAIGLMVDPALAQSFNLDLGDGSGSTTARIVQLLALLTVLSLAPSILVMVTSFTRIVVVLSFLRTAIGIQQSPPSSVIISLALFLTAFVMAPTLEAAWTTGLRPLINEEINETEALSRTIAPFHKFMMANVRERDLKLFLDISKTPTPDTREATPLPALVPA